MAKRTNKRPNGNMKARVDALGAVAARLGADIPRHGLMEMLAAAAGYRSSNALAAAMAAEGAEAPLAERLGQCPSPGGGPLDVLRDPRTNRRFSVEPTLSGLCATPYGSIVAIPAQPAPPATGSSMAGRASPSSVVMVHAAEITTRHERIRLVSASESDLAAQVRAFCAENWENVEHEAGPLDPGMADADVAEAYFRHRVGQRMETFSDPVDVALPAARPAGNARILKATIHLATVEHRHGLGAYADATAEGLYRKLADYCREYWSEVEDQAGEVDGYQADREIVSAYFDGHDSESLTTETTDIDLPHVPGEPETATAGFTPTDAERDAMIAALRLWQASGSDGIGHELIAIACNGRAAPLGNDGIDRLCEALNFGDAATQPEPCVADAGNATGGRSAREAADARYPALDGLPMVTALVELEAWVGDDAVPIDRTELDARLEVLTMDPIAVRRMTEGAMSFTDYFAHRLANADGDYHQGPSTLINVDEAETLEFLNALIERAQRRHGSANGLVALPGLDVLNPRTMAAIRDGNPDVMEALYRKQADERLALASSVMSKAATLARAIAGEGDGQGPSATR